MSAGLMYVNENEGGHIYGVYFLFKSYFPANILIVLSGERTTSEDPSLLILCRC